MLKRIKKWFQKNQTYFKLLLLGAIASGFIIPALALFYPAFFIILTRSAPLAFMTMMNFPLALLTLGLISIPTVLVAGISSAFLLNQLHTISYHVALLFQQKKTKALELYDSPLYMHRYLKAEKPYLNKNDHDDELYQKNFSSPLQSQQKQALSNPSILEEEDEAENHMKLARTYTS